MTTAERKIRLAQMLLETEDENTLREIEKALEEQREKARQYWEIIHALDWSKEGEDEAVLQPAIQQLSEHSERFILDFFDWFSEQLYRLDRRTYADASVEEGEPFSADLFLYARCAVLATGREYYESVRANPELFPKERYFEALLELPFEAYRLKTGNPLQKAPKYIYETGFNPEGWGDARGGNSRGET